MPRQRSDKSSGSARRQSSRSSTSCTIPVPSSRASSSRLPAVQQPRKEESTPAPTPAAAAATAPAAEAASKARGTGNMFKDMATTAAGVAAGSAVGHAVGAGITGLFGGRAKSAAANHQGDQAAAPVTVQAQGTSELVEDAPCTYELRQFLKCTEENSDLTVCQGFNEAMKECRRRYNI
ncbi:coiled-coil-helix-coiled-coil-helix domain-containing protein 10, mitochondrial-like [Drosophila obscura]|uniref:coiled-coil-helix-coiled-coil-helix domain-containing protein 10, mitochondrial-like n=1 Tax=Drosophila obscura TaxID=7282 RepID=UPI001BB1D5A2|nr:coiled-coil-helix-coiled-coil-helix domain-containing protein 10, mitochondrial-like [Drosophila obscura]